MTAAEPSSKPWHGIAELPENRLALKAVQRLARVGTPPFPILVLHGPSGTGKSLLASALVRRVIRGPAVRTVQSLAASELAFSTDADFDFADLVAVDLLVIEDVQQLAVSAMPQLSRLLDERGRRRRPTLITSNASPARLKNFPRRLVSRMISGLVVPLEPLSAASRKAILKLHLDGLRLEPAALDWLASRSTGGSVRPMLGTLDTLRAQHRGRATPLTLEQVRSLTGEVESPGVERIVRRVAETYGVKAKELLGPSRLRNVLLPRQVAMFLARDVAELSLPRIGEHFGRDHSTVQHAVNKIRTAMAGDRQLAGTIRQLRLELA